MPINAAWHAKHRMPKNATPAQRLKWHEAHATHCGCRPFTAAMREKLQHAMVAKARSRSVQSAGRSAPAPAERVPAGRAYATGMMRFPTAARMDAGVDVWFKVQAPALGAIARRWFLRMRQCGDDVRVLMHDGCPTACVGDAAFAYVGVYRAHANVGFFYGAELEDPMRLLQGSGKRMRHVKVKPGSAVDASALDALIAAAYVDVTRRLATDRRDERVSSSVARKHRARASA
ncbi:MAG: DUF1801 domain-containing protein [Vicinamibacterales bacterium]